MVDLDLDALGVNNQMGGGMGTQGNPLQAFAAMMEAMAGRAGGRAGARARQPGKGNMTVRLGCSLGELAAPTYTLQLGSNSIQWLHLFIAKGFRLAVDHYTASERTCVKHACI
jgi:hypothetical protein